MGTLQIPDCAYTHFIDHRKFGTTLEQGNKSKSMQDVINGWETFALADFIPGTWNGSSSLGMYCSL